MKKEYGASSDDSALSRIFSVGSRPAVMAK
jgi:hypothetical protein